MEFEFQLSAGANNGLGIHYPGVGDAAYTGMEIQILDGNHPKYKDLKDYQFHGGLYTLAAAKQGHLKPVGEWNKQRVTVKGSALKVELNGHLILDADFDKLSEKHPQHLGVKRRAGHIGWLGHGDRVAFKSIQIAELAPAVNEADLKSKGFTQIFDGKSFAGWKAPADSTNWKAIGGILKHNGQKGVINDMWSEKVYKDVTVAFDWRWSGRGPMKSQPVVMLDGTENGRVQIEELDSGIYLRGNTKSQANIWNWPIGSGEVYGYRTDGSKSREVRAGVTPKTPADRPLGEWNRMEVTIKGELLTVVLNGTTVIKDAQLPGVPAQGPIGFQHHGSAIDFANVWIKEL